MSILSGLTRYGLSGYYGGIVALDYPTQIEGALLRADDVREALASDETKRAIAADLCEHEGVGKACIDCTFKAESVQELLAGGDR